jgi:hypothetical protein
VFDLFSVVQAGIALFPLLGIAVVVMLVLRSRRPAFRIAPVPVPGDVVLQGHLWRPGDAVRTGWDETTYGTVVVTATELLWQGPAGPWRVPLGAITVIGADGFLGLTGPAVDLDVAGSGRWRLEVGQERINRFVRNDFKKARQAAECRWFAGVLLARGARPAPPPPVRTTS